MPLYAPQKTGASEQSSNRIPKQAFVEMQVVTTGCANITQRQMRILYCSFMHNTLEPDQTPFDD